MKVPRVPQSFAAVGNKLSDEEIEYRLQVLQRASAGWDPVTVSRTRFLNDLSDPEVSIQGPLSRGHELTQDSERGFGVE